MLVSCSSSVMRDPAQLVVAQQGAQVLQLLGQGLVLLADLHLLQLAQAAQAHVQDRLGLHVGQAEALDQARLGLLLLADDADHLVEVEVDQQVAVQDLQPALDRGQAVVGAADQDLVPVIEPGSG